MDSGKTLLDTAQEFLVPVDLQIRMQATLHEHASAAHLYRLTYLLVDGLEVQDIAFFGLGSF